MSLIDLGFTFDEAKKEQKSDFPPIPEAIYEVNIADCKEATSQNGNPYLNYQLAIQNCPDSSLNNRRLFYRVMLDGQPFSKKLMVDLVSGVGAQWTGTQFDPFSVVGLSGRVKVLNRKDKVTKEVIIGNDGNPEINIYFQTH